MLAKHTVGKMRLKPRNPLIKTPVVLKKKSNVFQHVDKALCTLYVPMGSRRAYHQVESWSEFENICEFNELTEANSMDNKYLAQRKQFKIN